MTAAEWIAVAIFLFGVIFAAGKIVSNAHSENKQLRADLNGLGRKMRKQKNIDLVVIAMTDDRIERFKLVGLLKED